MPICQPCTRAVHKIGRWKQWLFKSTSKFNSSSKWDSYIAIAKHKKFLFGAKYSLILAYSTYFAPRHFGNIVNAKPSRPILLTNWSPSNDLTTAGHLSTYFSSVCIAESLNCIPILDIVLSPSGLCCQRHLLNRLNNISSSGYDVINSNLLNTKYA